MYKAYKFRMYPTNIQKELLNKAFGCSRFIYNYYLNKIKNDKYISSFDNIKERIYECTNCKNTLDRDINASINIMNEGLKMHIKSLVV